MNLKLLSNETLTEKLRDLSQRDLALTAEIVSHIHEFMVRRLYFEHGYTSIFGYLTDQLGYPRATAQNRIDAARLLEAVPEIKEELASGKINLGQITLISMGVRQAEKENPGMKVSVDQKRQLVERIKNRGIFENFDNTANGENTVAGGNSGAPRSEFAAAQIVAQELDIKINPIERVRVHQDGSVTIEVHLSKEEFENLKRVRDLITRNLQFRYKKPKHGRLIFQNFMHVEKFDEVTFGGDRSQRNDRQRLDIHVISILNGEQIGLRSALLTDYKGPFTTGRHWCRSQDIGTILKWDVLCEDRDVSTTNLHYPFCRSHWSGDGFGDANCSADTALRSIVAGGRIEHSLRSAIDKSALPI